MILEGEVEKLRDWGAVVKKVVQRVVLGRVEYDVVNVCYTTHHLVVLSPAPPSPNLGVGLKMKTYLVNR